MVHIDRCFRRVDKHRPTQRLSYDRILSRGTGSVRRAGWIGRKIGVIYPKALDEFKLVLNVALITEEEQTTVYLGARGIMCDERRAIGNTSSEQPPFLRTAFTILGTRGIGVISSRG